MLCFSLTLEEIVFDVHLLFRLVNTSFIDDLLEEGPGDHSNPLHQTFPRFKVALFRMQRVLPNPYFCCAGFSFSVPWGMSLSLCLPLSTCYLRSIYLFDFAVMLGCSYNKVNGRTPIWDFLHACFDGNHLQTWHENQYGSFFQQLILSCFTLFSDSEAQIPNFDNFATCRETEAAREKVEGSEHGTCMCIRNFREWVQ